MGLNRSEGSRLRLQQVPNVLRRALGHPDWLRENVILLRRRRTERARDFDLSDYAEFLCGEREAVTALLGCEDAEYDQAESAFWAPVPPSAPGARWDSRSSLQHLVNAVTRILDPRVMVETGVARGFATAVSLRAMEDNGRGHLYSVDLPALQFRGDEVVGQAVPKALRHRWTLRVGPSRSVLPGLVREVAPIDIFLHDADHTYPSQLEEYETAWPYLRSGGVLLSDDVCNAAFLDFARSVGVRPILIATATEPSAIGVLGKP